MKLFWKVMLGVWISLGCLYPCFAQIAKPAPLSTGGVMSDFRNSPWGATEAQVKMAEHLKKSLEDSTSLLYSGKVLGQPADVYYLFHNGKLYCGQIVFKEQQNDGTISMMDFMKIKDAIESVFGKTETELHWSNPALEYSASAHKDQWGEAISQGYLSMDCTWSAGSVMSVLSLSGGSDGINLHFIAKNQTLAPPKPSAEGEF